MFSGRYNHAIDDKGRIKVPQKIKEALASVYNDTSVVITNLDKCLVAYPLEEWRKLEEKALKLPSMQKDVLEFLRYFFSGAEEVELDKMDRIHIPQSLKLSGNLNKEAVIVGIINRFEIWDRDLWDANFQGAKSNFESIAATMAQIGF
ncbi:MAG: division/cell wall cluster transcriptional repressor MraZ [Deltaproteobacteria bacterium]|jgi:MraZ protein|uniref:Transcriptional regulator MraZ n=1 Tax=Candidatus Acidulodesulfobacterium acidiphilum TaxID=2597224 RepID=A0A520XBQ0_9DELT|nr:division/cell wall cluster transcriptional repressor MraZ [Deltaproteobacteria bacterium]MDA8298762.1 division/cell wall cluster transcriptional repressor MraZ [Deltaproteobacteria bacterium]RZV38643.1 MAG: division/cell wall cluster transcriptional repressor MraZ [Candidatus Acidulodesulfobacterium acidiphilum]